MLWRAIEAASPAFSIDLWYSRQIALFLVAMQNIQSKYVKKVRTW